MIPEGFGTISARSEATLDLTSRKRSGKVRGGDHMKRNFMTLGATLVVLLTLGAPYASADTFTISNSNLGSGFSGPFGTVTITLGAGGTTATVTFQAQDSGITTGGATGYQFIDGSAADLNVNGSFSVSNLADTQLPGFHAQDTTAWTIGSGQVDGFGNFNLTISTQDGAGSAMDSISFTLTNTGGVWTSAANVLAANTNGNSVAAHIATCTTTPCTISSTGAVTGFGSQTPSVPDGGMTLMLLGGALVSLEALRRRVRA